MWELVEIVGGVHDIVGWISTPSAPQSKLQLARSSAVACFIVGPLLGVACAITWRYDSRIALAQAAIGLVLLIAGIPQICRWRRLRHS